MKILKALGLLFALTACNTGESDGTERILRATVASVDGSPVLADALALQLLRQYGGILVEPDSDWLGVSKRLLNQEIDLKLLAEEAARRQITPLALRLSDRQTRGWSAAELRRRLDELGLSEQRFRARLQLRQIADELVRLEAGEKPVSEDEIQTWIKANPQPERVQIRHLVVRDQDRAKEAKKRLESGKSFTDIAMLYGEGPEATRGGLLPPFGRQQMPSVFDAAFQLKIGQVSEPLSSEHGWHLLRLERRLEPEVHARELALTQLIRQRSEMASTRLLKRLRKQADIQIDLQALNELVNFLKTNHRASQ